MEKALNQLKHAWEENPLAVIGVGATAIMAVAKLMDANTSRRNRRVWELEVQRRLMKNRNR